MTALEAAWYCRYGLLMHEGDADSGQVAGYYQRFVKLEKKKK